MDTIIQPVEENNGKNLSDDYFFQFPIPGIFEMRNRIQVEGSLPQKDLKYEILMAYLRLFRRLQPEGDYKRKMSRLPCTVKGTALEFATE